MNSPTILYLLMYDITHDRTLQKAAKIIEKMGYERINYSVWIGWQKPTISLIEWKSLRRLLQQPCAEGSKLYYMPLTSHNLKKLRSITGHSPGQLDYWTGERRIEFF